MVEDIVYDLSVYYDAQKTIAECKEKGWVKDRDEYTYEQMVSPSYCRKPSFLGDVILCGWSQILTIISTALFIQVVIKIGNNDAVMSLQDKYIVLGTMVCGIIFWIVSLVRGSGLFMITSILRLIYWYVCDLIKYAGYKQELATFNAEYEENSKEFEEEWDSMAADMLIAERICSSNKSLLPDKFPVDDIPKLIDILEANRADSVNEAIRVLKADNYARFAQCDCCEEKYHCKWYGKGRGNNCAGFRPA